MSDATNYEDMFASRFTAEDAEFQRYRLRPPDAPPALEDWRAARARRDRREPQQQHHHHHHHQERRWSDRRDDRRTRY